MYNLNPKNLKRTQVQNCIIKIYNRHNMFKLNFYKRSLKNRNLIRFIK